MDRKQIEQWASEAKGEQVWSDESGALYYMSLGDLVRFAALVAAHEREQCIKACEAERLEDPQDIQDDAYNQGVTDCTHAIRARVKLAKMAKPANIT